MAIFTGAGVALITPMNEDGSVNYEKLRELLEFHVANKTDAIIICGTTGESSTMPDEEHKSVIKFTAEKVNKRIPVIAGTGSNDTAHAIELSKYAESVGADGLLIVTPYYNKTTQNRRTFILPGYIKRTCKNSKYKRYKRSHRQSFICSKYCGGN